MNALIIYDSVFGNTRTIAEVLASLALEYFPSKHLPVNEVGPDELQTVKLLLMGSPTQNYQPTPRIQAFLENIPQGMVQGVIAAAFDTRYRVSHWSSGTAAWAIAQGLQNAGAVLALPPESFFVSRAAGPLEEGEMERATQWARVLCAKALAMALEGEHLCFHRRF